MYQLICDSHAAALYVKSFLERKKTKEFNADLDDGSAKVGSNRADKSGKPSTNQSKAAQGQAAADASSTPTLMNLLSSTRAEDEESSFQAFKTPIDYVKRRKLRVADRIEEQTFLTSTVATDRATPIPISQQKSKPVRSLSTIEMVTR